jgi:MFS transporter, DHA3 family, macrolide efflux protein
VKETNDENPNIADRVIPTHENEGDAKLNNMDAIPDWQKKVVLFLSGQTMSLFGSALVQFAIIWHITLTTKSGWAMTISTVCAFLPQILISLFAGVWADRYNRKLLIIFSDIMIAVSTLVLAVLFLLGFNDLWLLFLVSGIRSAGAGIQSPAVNALIPQIVPKEKLIKVNGINGSIQALIMLLSPAASGALMSLSTLEAIFFIDVATAIIAILIMLFLQVPLHKKAAEKQTTGYFDDLKEGLNYIPQNVFLRNLMAFYALFFFLVTPAAFLTPLMITRSYGEEVWRLTANEMSFFAGSMIGGIIIATWGGFKNRVYTIGLACVAFGILTTALGLSSTFVIYLIVIFVTGLFIPFFSSSSTVLLQEKVDPDMHGRVFALVQIVSSAAMPLGMLVFGPIADIVQVEQLLIITGVLMAISGASIFYNKGLKGVG